MEMTQEKVNEFEDRLMETIQHEEWKDKKRLNQKNEQSIRSAGIKKSATGVTVLSEGKMRDSGVEKYLKK